MAEKVTYTITLNDLLSSKLKDAEGNAVKLDNQMGKLDGTVSKIGGTIAAAFAIDKIVSFGGKVVETLAEFEKYDAVLTTTLGSGSAADAAMKNITEFAAKTPFGVSELTGSFVKLANMGFKPTMEEMTKLGDLASSKGKSFDQLSEAMIDAQTGEFERLKEFGIRASKDGDKVSFMFKGQTTTIQNTSDAISQYILGLGDMQGVVGGMAAISATTGGQLSNLEDNVTSLYLQIGEALKPAISGIIESMSGFIDTMKSAVDWLVKNKEAVGLVASALAGAGAAIVAYKGYMMASALVTGIWTAYTTAAAAAEGGLTVAQWALNMAMNANPIGLVVAAIGALVGAVIYAWNNFETFRSTLLGVWAVIKEGVNTAINHFMALWDVIAGVFTLDFDRVQKGFEEGFNNLKNAGSRMGAAFKKGYDTEMGKFEKKEASDKFTQSFNQKIDQLRQLESEGKISAQGYTNAIMNMKTELNKNLKSGIISRDIYDREWERLAAISEMGMTSPQISTKGDMTDNTKSKKDTSPKGASGSKSVTITINIQKLIEDFKVETTNIVGAGANQVREAVAQALLGAVNDSQIVAGI